MRKNENESENESEKQYVMYCDGRRKVAGCWG